MKRILLFLLILPLLSLSVSSASAKINWLNGHWKGMKYQVNMNKAWQTELDIDIKKGVFNIAYPELNCSGKLVLKSSNGKKAVFEEQIPTGECISGGKIIITQVDPRHISFSCFRDNNERLASYCTLEKS